MRHSVSKRYLVFFVAFIAIFALTLSGCTKKPEEKKEEVIKIGAILPLTGSFSTLGDWFKVGFQLAEDEINSEPGGVRIKVLYEDGRSDVASSVSAYRKLVQVDKVRIVSTTTSPVCLALKPLAIQDKVLLFANAAHPAITTGNNLLILRHSNTIPQEGEIIAKFVESELKPTKGSVAIIFLNNDFGLEFKNFLLKSLADKITNYESYEANQTEFKNLVAKIMAKNPKHIILIGFTKNLGLILKTLRERGYTGTIISNFGFTIPGVAKIAGKSMRGVYYIDYAFPMTSKHLQKLSALAKAKYNSTLTPVSLLSYDVLYLVADAVKAIGSTNPEDIAKYIRGKSVFDIKGIKIKISANGDILPPLEMKRYE